MLSLFISNAYAQESGAGGAGSLMSLAPMLLIGVVFYFLLIRPQNKKLKEEREYNASLKKGDEVYTKAGVIGTIHGITDKIVTLEIEGGTKIKMLRGTVAGPSSQLFEEKKETK